jgi:DNA-binding MarR family transcriptional regulator
MKVVDDVRWLDEDEERAWRSFQLMQMRLNAELARDLSAHSPLSYQDYVVLVALTDRPDGRMRLFELAHHIGWEKSRTSHQVTRMAERGLVEKYPCGADRRGQVVEVTARGWDGIRAAAPSHVGAVRRLFVDRLTPAQLDQMTTVAATVLAAVAQHERRSCDGGNGEVGAGPCSSACDGDREPVPGQEIPST